MTAQFVIVFRSCPASADGLFEDGSTALQRLQISLVFDIEGAHDLLEALPSALAVCLQLPICRPFPD